LTSAYRIEDLEDAGFVNWGREGHRNFVHSKVTKPITISGNLGDDARPYQEKAVKLAKEGGALKSMLLPFKLGVGGRVGSGKQWWSWVATDDLVAAYAYALRSDIDGAVNVTSPNPATNGQFTKALGSVLRRPTIFPVPALAARALFGEMGDAMLLGGQRVLPARLLDAGFEFSAPTIDAGLARALAA